MDFKNIFVVICFFIIAFTYCGYVITAQAEQMTPTPETQPEEDMTAYMLYNPDGAYWIENGMVAGRPGDPKNIWDTQYNKTERGREIYDPESDGWYWLDTCYNGRVATHKEVWFPYVYSFEEPGSTQGKWTRYNASGEMIKEFCYVESEEDPQDKALYFYDTVTGAMMKGNITLYDDYGDERTQITIYFDRITGRAEITPELFEMLNHLHTSKWKLTDFKRGETTTLERWIEVQTEKNNDTEN